jgi:RNA polymerase sigma-70 factor, ECF subfamily
MIRDAVSATARNSRRPLPEPEEERRLLESLRAGEHAAFETLVRTYSGRLLAVTRRLLRDEEDARDALQEALLSAFRSLAGFQGEARLSTWLHRIAVNCALMKMRARRCRPQEDPIDDLLPTFLPDGHVERGAVPWREGADMMLERTELCGLVRGCIDRLPESYRTVLLLRDVEELDTEETARLLGITPNNVKIRLHRARLALRGLLDPHLRQERV